MNHLELARLWEKTTHPRVAALFALLPSPPPFSGDTDAWVIAARGAKPADRGPLIATLFEGKLAEIERKLAAIETWRDPRLSAALERVIREVPWSSNTSRSMWTKVFTLVERSRDPRFVKIAAEAPASWTIRSAQRTHLLAQLERAVEGLPKTHVELTADEAEAIFADEREAHAAPRPVAVKQKAGADFAAIYARPDDDAPRHVLADALLEAGDPRGEFVQLQLMAKRSPADEKKMKALLKAHGKQWLTPFGTALGVEVVWRRGFPAEGLVKFRNQADADRFGGLAEWATFEALQWSPPRTTEHARAAGFIGPAFRHLRHASGVHLEHLCEAKTTFALKTVQGVVGGVAGIDALRESGAVPKLEALRCDDAFLQADWVDACARWPTLAEFGVMTNYPPSLLQVLARAERVTSLLRLRWGEAFVFHRDAQGRLSRLELLLPNGSYQAGAQLAKLPDGAVSELLAPPAASWTTGEVGRTLERLLEPGTRSVARAAAMQVNLDSPLYAVADATTMLVSGQRAGRVISLATLEVVERIVEPTALQVLLAPGRQVLDLQNRVVVREGGRERVLAEGPVRLLHLSGDGQRALVRDGARVKVLDVASKEELFATRGSGGLLDRPGARVVVIDGQKTTVHVLATGARAPVEGWHFTTCFLEGDRFAELVKGRLSVKAIAGGETVGIPWAGAYSGSLISAPDGRSFAAVQHDKTTLFDAATLEVLGTGPSARLGAYAPDGKLYVLADDTIVPVAGTPVAPRGVPGR